MIWAAAQRPRALALALAATALLFACARPTTAPGAGAVAHEWGGFFRLDDARAASRAGVELGVLGALRPRVVRLLLAKGRQPLSAAELARRRAFYCGDARPWNTALCDALDRSSCSGEDCTADHFGSCSGFLVGGQRVWTAAHCLGDAGRDRALLAASYAVMVGDDGAPTGPLRIEGLKLSKHDFSHGFVSLDEAAPMDVAEVSLRDLAPVWPWPVAAVPARGEVVFHVGFPRAERRDLSPGLLRVSYGRVHDRNDGALTLCSTDGRQTGWRLASRCEVETLVLDGEPAWRGPITSAPFVSSMDTVNGYSGAPVFDAKGRLVGVSSTVLGDTNPQDAYGADLFAVATPALRAAAKLGSVDVAPLPVTR